MVLLNVGKGDDSEDREAKGHKFESPGLYMEFYTRPINGLINKWVSLLFFSPRNQWSYGPLLK